MQNDDYLWLEALDDPKVTDWVNQQNAITEQRFEGTDLFKALHQEQEELMTAEDRTAFGRYFQGWYWNFWQDQNHEKGLWRRCTPEEYRKEKPAWETILDIDALAAEEGKDWVYRYASKFSYTSSRRMLWLSEGGGDARVAREFDTETKSFVDGGFFLPAAKSDIVAVDEDNLLVSTDFGPGSLTESGYPRTVRLWKRGTDLMDAPIILEGREKDLVVDMHKWTQGETETIMVYRAMDFYHQEYSIWDPDTGDLKKIIAPTSLQLGQVIDHWIYGKCQEGVEISGKIIPADTVFRFHLDQGIAASLEVIFKPNHNQAITDFQITFDHQVYLTILQDITSRILLVQKREAQWLVEELPFPKNSNMHFSLADENDPGAKTELYVTSHLEPYSKYHVDQQCGLHLIKRSKPRFDSSKLAVSQNFALSKDGTKVPYFLLESKAAERAGSAPTLLYGYGGFNIKLSPSYNPSVGKSWLERGGTYVVANIRGGGEYGTAWHQAALKTKRQKAYDDFIAVAQDLITRGITSPEHLGIWGGSNGGLLVGAVMTQRPELFNAVLCEVPLLDMERYTKLLAGASWVAEYGDPENPQERDALLAYSPFHNVFAEQTYPEVLFKTSAADDRVHPGHARKMAAKMLDQGHKILFWENNRGGHGSATGPKERAKQSALSYAYFWEKPK